MSLHTFRFRGLAVVAVALLAACGGESTGPAGQLDPAATQAQIAAIDEAFSGTSVAAFEGASVSIDEALGTSGAFASVFASPSSLTSPTRLQALAQRSYARLAPQGAATDLAGIREANALPTGVLGRTFIWSGSTGRYVVADVPPSGLPPVPANGVRFVLYAWDTALERPSEPLTTVGYADLTETTTSAGRTYRLVVTGGSTVFLDYSTSFSFSQSAQRATLGVSGFVTNGTTRANFVLDNTVSAENNGSVTFDYDVRVPSENVSLDYAVNIRNLSDPLGDEEIGIDLQLAGTGGRIEAAGTLDIVTETGTVGESDDFFFGVSGVLTVRVNGGTFARITLDGNGDPLITDADGNALTPEEADALEAVFDLLGEGFEFIDALLRPIDQLFD